jgi:hypothetical protein
MKKFLHSTILAIAVLGTTAGTISVSAFAQSPAAVEQVQDLTKPFTKKKYKIKGSWSLIQRDGQNIIKFSDDFKTKNGPDLKIFLSPQSIEQASGKTAVNDAINLGELKSNKGAQEYVIPAGTDLSLFNSVLVHCEAYSVLWGGGAL